MYGFAGELIPSRFSGFVASVHEGVLNIDAGGFFVSIVTRPLDRTALSVFLPAAAAPLWAGVGPGTPVRGCPDCLEISTLGRIKYIRERRRFTGILPRRNGRELSACALRDNAKALRAYLEQSPEYRRGFVPLLFPPPPAEGDGDSFVRRARRVLAEAEAAVSGVPPRVDLSGLVGLGPGFTPAGDDFTAGVILAEDILAEDILTRHGTTVGPCLDRAAIEHALNRTTTGGATLLRLALAGRPPLLAHRIYAILAGTRRAGGCEDWCGKILEEASRFGHSSGLDVLAGFIWRVSGKENSRVKRIILRKDSYYDSVFLMLISTEVKKMEGVTDAVVAMGTEMNLDLIGEMGMGGSELKTAGPNDLIISLKTEKKATLDEAEALVEQLLRKKADQGSGAAYRHTSSSAAFDALPESNLVVISVPGEHAPREVRKALRAGKHVMLFSDNVSLEEEVSLKALAREQGLLLMGPDCGTAIINGKPLCFANMVSAGTIGVVSASGTGLQEVTSLISRMGGGISQGIGTGGRDLKSEEVGGSTTLMAIQALAEDPETRAIAVISKPPAPKVAETVVKALRKAGKPAVIHLIGMEKRSTEDKLHYAGNLEETARTAVALAAGKPVRTQVFDADEKEIEGILERETASIGSRQKYLRGYFTGGTLTDEAVFVLNDTLGGVHSFDPADPAFKLEDPHVSRMHTIVDLGEDVFTLGRPHPMIDPSTRTERMEREVADEEIALVMIDCVIGYGSHPDPAGAVAPAIRAMKSAAEKRGGYLAVVASVTGTDGDFQNFAGQKRTLEEAGVVVMPSNYQAAELAKRIMIRLNSR